MQGFFYFIVILSQQYIHIGVYVYYPKYLMGYMYISEKKANCVKNMKNIVFFYRQEIFSVI